MLSKFRTSFVQAALIVLAIILVRFRMWPIDDWKNILVNWQEISLVVIAILDGFISKPHKNKLLVDLMLRFSFFFYVASAVLSANLSMGATNNELLKTIGVAFLAVGFVLHLQNSRLQTDKQLDYSLIAYLTGLPLVFGSWLTLAAVPGIIVMMKWLAVKE